MKEQKMSEFDFRHDERCRDEAYPDWYASRVTSDEEAAEAQPDEDVFWAGVVDPAECEMPFEATS